MNKKNVPSPELSKELQKINHACGDCVGMGVQIGVESDGEQCQEPCKTCSGTGIDIPLEFGCEVRDSYTRFIFK